MARLKGFGGIAERIDQRNFFDSFFQCGLHVVGQLLEFARPVTISKKPVSIKSFIESSVKLVERQAAEKNIRVETDLSAEMETVRLDPDKMNQVLLNLYLNAIDAMDAEGGNLMVALDCEPENHRAEIRVIDTGAGISETDLAHIFDPYFTTKASGTGLGLAIAHKILEGHGGEIKVDSRPGSGTTVTLILPSGESKADES